MNDLVDHMHEFQTKGILMKHSKDIHSEKVRPCIKYNEGKCDFRVNCWFSHDQSKNSVLPDFACNICDDKFKIQSKFMKHKKEYHTESIPMCRDKMNGYCHYGANYCWFKHEENNDEKYETESSNMIKKLYDTLEIFGHRLAHIEDKI